MNTRCIDARGLFIAPVGLVSWAVALFCFATLRCMASQEPNTIQPESVPTAGVLDFHGMYIDDRNQVHLVGSGRTVSLTEAVAVLSTGDRDADEIRKAVSVMRKRLEHLNAEIRGTQLGKQRIENHSIAVRRSIRTNEIYLRVPSSNDTERLQRTEQQSDSSLASSQVVKLSAAEESGSLGHGNVTIAPYLNVAPNRYAIPSYDPELAKNGLQICATRLKEYDTHLEDLLAMKRQLALGIISLESVIGHHRRLGPGYRGGLSELTGAQSPMRPQQHGAVRLSSMRTASAE